jgi:hypothetical protein
LLVFFIAFAGLSFGNQMQLGFAVSSMTDKVLERTFAGIGYESNVRFIGYEDIGSSDNQLPYTAVYGDILFGEDTVAHGELVVFENGSDVFKLLNADNKKEINLNTLDGVVVNDWMRHKYDLSLGDVIIFCSDGKTFSLPIAAFERSAFGRTIYCGYGYAEKNALLESQSYNGVFTKDMVTFDPQKHIYISTVEDMRGDFQIQKETYSTLSILFFVLGALVGFITIQIALRSVINANRKYIAMMKAYGYSEKERNRSMLSKYRLIAYLGFLIGSGYAYIIIAIMFSSTAKTSDMIVPVTVDIWAMLIAPLMFILAYEFIIWAYGRKINAISLKEIMDS